MKRETETEYDNVLHLDFDGQCVPCRAKDAPGDGEEATLALISQLIAGDPLEDVHGRLCAEHRAVVDQVAEQLREQDDEDEPEAPGQVWLSFCVNGDTVSIECVPHCPVRDACAAAIAKAQHEGRPLDEWELRDVNGATVAMAGTVRHVGLVGARHFSLALKIGTGA